MPIPNGYESIDLLISENDTDVDSGNQTHGIKIKEVTPGKQIKINLKVKATDNPKKLYCTGYNDDLATAAIEISIGETKDVPPIQTTFASFTNGKVTFLGTGFIVTGIVTNINDKKRHAMSATMNFTEIPSEQP